jgi:K+/H+ antiporter YhaU regulatory subunit KhtT
MKYFGIADAHGIESFVKGSIEDKEHSSAATMMYLRASANRHRHAVVYVVDIDESTAKDIDEILESGDYVEALVRLKMSVKELSLANLPGSEKSWRLIPNSDLDPYQG